MGKQKELNENLLPEKEELYSNLKNEDITNAVCVDPKK